MACKAIADKAKELRDILGIAAAAPISLPVTVIASCLLRFSYIFLYNLLSPHDIFERAALASTVQ